MCGQADLGGGTVAMLVCGAVAAVLMSLAAGGRMMICIIPVYALFITF